MIQPVYIILQTSDSMRGAPIQRALEAIGSMWYAFRHSPVALESIEVTVIGHGDGARVIVPATAIENLPDVPQVDLKGRPAVEDAVRLFALLHQQRKERAINDKRLRLSDAILVFISNSEHDVSVKGKPLSSFPGTQAQRFLVQTESGECPIRGFLDDRKLEGECGYCATCLSNRLLVHDASKDGLGFGEAWMHYWSRLVGSCPPGDDCIHSKRQEVKPARINSADAALYVSTQARRLPIYLLVDTSGSMQGDPIRQVLSQLRAVLEDLRKNPWALECIHLCLITFGSAAKVEVPLTSLETFDIPTHLEASGATAMGEALQLLCRTRAADLKRKTATGPGDWRPIVFLLTDGIPTDDFDAGLAEFKRQRWGVRVAFAVNGADEVALLRFLDNVDATRGTPDETSNLFPISTSGEFEMKVVLGYVGDFILPKACPAAPAICEVPPETDGLPVPAPQQLSRTDERPRQYPELDLLFAVLGFVIFVVIMLLI